MIPSSPPLNMSIGSFAVKQRHSTISACPGRIVQGATGLYFQMVTDRRDVVPMISLLSGM